MRLNRDSEAINLVQHPAANYVIRGIEQLDDSYHRTERPEHNCYEDAVKIVHQDKT